MNLKNALNFLFPPICGICNKKQEKEWICENCFKNLKKEMNYKNKLSKIKFNDYKLYYLFTYEKIIRKLILDYKFKNKAYLNKLFLDIILKNKMFCNLLNSYDIIISVPMTKNKKIIRGYNQVSIIAKELEKFINARFINNVLIKIKENKKQSTLSYYERKKNVEDVYKLDQKYKDMIKDKKIIIFDDIYTTGFTVNECIKEIRKYGASKVDAFVIAKGVMERR